MIPPPSVQRRCASPRFHCARSASGNAKIRFVVKPSISRRTNQTWPRPNAIHDFQKSLLNTLHFNQRTCFFIKTGIMSDYGGYDDGDMGSASYLGFPRERTDLPTIATTHTSQPSMRTNPNSNLKTPKMLNTRHLPPRQHQVHMVPRIQIHKYMMA